MEANNSKLVTHTYEGADTMLERGTSVCKERSTGGNRVVAQWAPVLTVRYILEYISLTGEIGG